MNFANVSDITLFSTSQSFNTQSAQNSNQRRLSATPS